MLRVPGLRSAPEFVGPWVDSLLPDPFPPLRPCGVGLRSGGDQSAGLVEVVALERHERLPRQGIGVSGPLQPSLSDLLVGGRGPSQQLGAGGEVVGQPVPFLVGGVGEVPLDDVAGGVARSRGGGVRPAVAGRVVLGELDEQPAPVRIQLLRLRPGRIVRWGRGVLAASHAGASSTASEPANGST